MKYDQDKGFLDFCGNFSRWQLVTCRGTELYWAASESLKPPTFRPRSCNIHPRNQASRKSPPKVTFCRKVEVPGGNRCQNPWRTMSREGLWQASGGWEADTHSRGALSWARVLPESIERGRNMRRPLLKSTSLRSTTHNPPGHNHSAKDGATINTPNFHVLRIMFTYYILRHHILTP